MLACILAIVLLACAQEAVTQRSTCRQASCCTPTPYIELSFTLYLDAPELSDCEAPELLDRGVRLMALIEGYDAWTPIRFYSRTTNSTAIDGIPLAILTEDSHVLVRDIPRLGGNRTYPLRLIRSSEPVHITEYLCGDFAQPNTDFIWIQYMTGEVNKDENVWYLDDITLRYWDGYCLRVIVQQDFSNSTLSDKFSFARGSVQPPLCGLTNSDGNVFFLNGESVNMARPRHRRRFRMQNLIYMNRSCVQSANDLETYAPGYDHDVCSIGSTDCLCNKGYRQNSSHCLDINECAEGTDNCSQHCINTEGSFKCACYSGYRLNEEATTCDDIDDCTENLHNCSHECVNLDGGYKCLCGSGYVVGGDGFTCQEQAVIGFLLPMFEVIRGESSDVCVGLLGGSLSTSVTINLLIINTNCSTNKNFSLALDALTPIVCVNVSAMENGLKCEIFTLLLRTTHSAVILNPNATTVHILDPKLNVTIGFERDHYSVREEDKTLEVCAAVTKGELSGATEVQLTVDTLSSDATVSSDATALQDFTPITGQAINFDSENQRVCMDIAILEDEYVEANETFTIVLLGFTVSLIPHLATVTIVDNDVIVIGITTNTPVVSEDVGVVNVTVTLLQGVPFRPLALQVFTVDGTSTVPVDYSAMNNNVTLSSNVTQVHLSISVLDDPYLEYEEHFFVKLLLVSDTLQVVTLSSDTLSIRIMDNDVITVGFDPDMYNVSENEERVVVCVRLLGVTERDFSVNAAVISGNATPALDYSLPQSTVLLFRFNATADTSCLEIEVTDDYIPELQEQVTLQLDANATFVMLSPDTATINIADNDMVAVGFDSDIYNVVENEERVVVCLRLFEGVIERDFSVSATVINGNATTDLDYSLPQLQFIFNVTTTNSCLVIEVTDDSAFELSEQFTLQLDTSFTFVLLSPDTATVHITDNDYPAVSFQEEAYTVTQGYVSVTLCVDVVGLRHAVVRVTVHTEDGSATSASGDYTATTEELEFPELSNISRKCFVVNISSNVALESSKFFQVVLTSMAFNDTASVYIIQSNSAEFQVKNLASLIQSGNITVEEAAQILDEVLNTQINSGTLASQNFSQNFISVADTLLTVESMHSDPTMDDGFMVVISVLNTLDTFALRAYDPTGGTLETDDEHIKLDVTMLDVSRYEDQSVVGISEAGNEIIIPSELLNQVGYLNVTLASFFFKNISEILPATEKSKVISPVISSTLGCGNSSCKLSPTSQEFVRFTLLHSNTGGMNTTCVFLNFTSDRVELSDEGCAVVESNATVTVCECNHLTHFAILLSPNNPVSGRHIVNLQVIGYVGVSISLLCLLITVVVFICIRALWSMRVFIHINLCINLMIAQVIFISAVDKTANKRGCQAVAVLLQYFFLVTFMWMLMEGVVLYVVLVRVFIKHHKRYVAGFTVASYGIPAIYMGVLSLPLGFALNNEPDYGSESACWLNYDTHFIWAFIVPIIVIILLNVGFFIMAIVIMFKHERKGAKKARFQRIIHWLKSSISLVIIMGVTWIIGVLAFHKALLAFAYIFTICVAFQGCFIFILFVVLSPQVREQCKKWWRHRVASSEFLSQHFGSSGDERFLHRQLTRLTSFRTSFSSRESHITQRSRGFSTTENGKNGSVIAAELVTKEPPPSDILNEYVSSPVIMGDDEKVSEAEYIRPPVHVTPHTEAETTDVDTVSMGLPPSTKRPPSTELSQSTELPSTCDNTECTDL